MHWSIDVIEIHPTAVIHPGARLGDGVKVGPYAVIGEHVSIGAGTVIGAHAVIEPYTTMGVDCQVFSGAIIGGVPQDLKFGGEESYTVIGDRNIIRECVTINRATGMGEETRIGDDNMFQAYVHVAHNCVIGNQVIMSNCATLAGHVSVEDYAIIGGLAGIHQFCRVGTMAMVGAMSRVTQDVPPYMLIEGAPPKVLGPNVIGLRRRGLGQDERTLIKRAYKLMYRSDLNFAQALEAIAQLEDSPYLRHLIAFVESSERGVTGRSNRASGAEASA
ncbi:Acyl-[acyl-carrier-protein]--UDP-N-acetylglucosamine O-acyltransferase [compost metagenome]